MRTATARVSEHRAHLHHAQPADRTKGSLWVVRVAGCPQRNTVMPCGCECPPEKNTLNGAGRSNGPFDTRFGFTDLRPVAGLGRRVSIEAAGVDRCTVAGVGLTVCRARDQCASLEPPGPLVSGRPGPVARGVSSEPTATRCLSGQRSTISRSRPRSRRSAAPMTPLPSNQPSSPTAAGTSAACPAGSRRDRAGARGAAAPLPPLPPPGPDALFTPTAPTWRRSGRWCCSRPGGRPDREPGERPGAGGQRGGRQRPAAHPVGRDADDLAPAGRARVRDPGRGHDRRPAGRADQARARRHRRARPVARLPGLRPGRAALRRDRDHDPDAHGDSGCPTRPPAPRRRTGG